MLLARKIDLEIHVLHLLLFAPLPLQVMRPFFLLFDLHKLRRHLNLLLIMLRHLLQQLLPHLMVCSALLYRAESAVMQVCRLVEGYVSIR